MVDITILELNAWDGIATAAHNLVSGLKETIVKTLISEGNAKKNGWRVLLVQSLSYQVEFYTTLRLRVGSL